MSLTVIAGNPKPRSRTFQAATLVAERLTGRAPDLAIDLVDLGAALLDWSDPGVARLVTAVQASELMVVASPTYKATYTGLLKLFLDRFPGGSLAGVTAVPVMLGAHWKHGLAADLLLTGRHITADEAKAIGLIGHVVADGQALAKALEIAGMIAANGPLAVQAILRTIRESEGMAENDAFALESKIGMAVFSTEDAKEGPRAFAAKRTPEFRGR